MTGPQCATNGIHTPNTPPGRGPCPTCGQPRCVGTSTRTKCRCRHTPIPGGTVCGTHGGRAPQVRAAAAARIVARKATADAAAVLAHEGLAGIEDPLEELSLLAREAREFQRALGRRVNALDGVRFTDDRGGEQLRAELGMWERAMDRCGRFLSVLVDKGFAERQTKLAEQQGRLLVGVLQAVERRMDLSDAQALLWLRVVPEELRAVVAGETSRVIEGESQ